VNARRSYEGVRRGRGLHRIDAGVAGMQGITVQRTPPVRGQAEVVAAPPGVQTQVGAPDTATSAGHGCRTADTRLHDGREHEGLAIRFAARRILQESRSNIR